MGIGIKEVIKPQCKAILWETKAGCKLLSMAVMLHTPGGVRGVGDEVREMDSG